MGKTKNFTGENFWARGYFVSTVGLDREQEKEEEHYEQLSLWK
jgi:putative transposase